MTCYAAETLEELGQILGYSGESLKNFLREAERYNAFCAAGRDGDWGCDPGYLFLLFQSLGIEMELKSSVENMIAISPDAGTDYLRF